MNDIDKRISELLERKARLTIGLRLVDDTEPHEYRNEYKAIAQELTTILNGYCVPLPTLETLCNPRKGSYTVNPFNLAQHTHELEISLISGYRIIGRHYRRFARKVA